PAGPPPARGPAGGAGGGGARGAGGAPPPPTTDPAATRAALEAASFVVALELRETEVTRVADVVFPVAAAVEKAGTFVNWEGRVRPFEAVLPSPSSLPDLRVLAGISEELAAAGHGAALGFRTVDEVRAEMADLGAWDGDRSAMHSDPLSDPTGAAPGEGVALSTWKQLIDDGAMQAGDKHLAATARPAVARLSPATYAAASLSGGSVTVVGDRGELTLPVEQVPGMVDDVVWVPSASFGTSVLERLASPGSRVSLKGASL
ncbi:MAG: molybdopterin-dependent oxidoreductase, partial [Nocardioides marinisabuli]|uniref:molybdopterin-dependent oxidoreductase n=1 Tax=Nocardioides marinisabuli TaxID=419476 RepID=UPI00321C1EA0